MNGLEFSYELEPIVDELVYLLPQFLNLNETVCQGNVFCRRCNPEALIKPCSKDVLDCHCFLTDSCSNCEPDLQHHIGSELAAQFPASDPLPRLDRPISQPGVGSAGIDVHEAARSHAVYMSVPNNENKSVPVGAPVSRFQYSKLPPIPRYLQGSLRVPQYDLTTDNTQPHCTNSDRPFLIAPLLTEDLDLWFYSELGDRIFRRVMENSLQYDRTYVKLSRLAEDDNIDEGIYQTLDFNDWIKFSRLCYRVASDVSSQSSLPDSDEFTTTFHKGERIKPSFGSSNHALRQRYGLQNDWASMKMGDSEIIIHGGLLKQRHLGSRIELAKLAQLCTTRWFFQGVDSTRTRLCNAISAYKKQICEAGAAGTSNIVDYVSAIGLDKAGILGKGVCGSVIEGKHGITAFAVKTVDLKGRDDPFSIIDSEMNPVRWSHIKSQSRMRHRYSQPIGLISAWIDVNKERLYLLTPREDTLTDFIALWNRRLTNANLIEKSCYRLICASIMHQIFEQLRFMHGRGITHGDIYPRNIVLNLVTLEPEIIDFSSSQTVNDDVITASDGECSTVDESESSPAVWSGASSIQDEAFDLKVARHIYEALLPGLTDANSRKIAGAFTRGDVSEEHALILKLENRSINSETVLKELSGIISHITGNMTSNDDGIKQLRALPFQFRQRIGFQYHSTNISWRTVVIDPPIRQIRHIASILNMTDGNIRLAFYLACLLEMVFSLHTSPSSNFYCYCLGLQILSTLLEVILIATGSKSIMQAFDKSILTRLLEPIRRTCRIVQSSYQHLLQNETATGPGGVISPTIRRILDTSLLSRSCGRTGDSWLPERIQKCTHCLSQHISACVVTISLLLSSLLVWLPRFSPSWSTTLLISDVMIEALSNDDDYLHQAFIYQRATNYLCMLLRPYSHVFSWYLEFSFVLHELALAAVWITAIHSVAVVVGRKFGKLVSNIMQHMFEACLNTIRIISATLVSVSTGDAFAFSQLTWPIFAIACYAQYHSLVNWPSMVSAPVTFALSLNLLCSFRAVPAMLQQISVHSKQNALINICAVAKLNLFRLALIVAFPPSVLLQVNSFLYKRPNDLLDCKIMSLVLFLDSMLVTFSFYVVPHWPVLFGVSICLISAHLTDLMDYFCEPFIRDPRYRDPSFILRLPMHTVLSFAPQILLFALAMPAAHAINSLTRSIMLIPYRLSEVFQILGGLETNKLLESYQGPLGILAHIPARLDVVPCVILFVFRKCHQSMLWLLAFYALVNIVKATNWLISNCRSTVITLWSLRLNRSPFRSFRV